MPSFIFSTLSFAALNLKTTRVSSSPSSRKNLVFKTALFIVFFHPSAGGLIAFFCKPLENGNVAANAHPCSSAKGLHRYLFPYRFFQQCSLCKRISLYCFDVCSKLDTSFALRYFALISHKTSFGKRESASVVSSSSSSSSSLVVVVVVVVLVGGNGEIFISSSSSSPPFSSPGIRGKVFFKKKGSFGGLAGNDVNPPVPPP